MGSLNMHNVAGLVKKHNLTGFAETGLYKGDGLAFAARHEFEKLLSIDIQVERISAGVERFDTDSRITLFLGNSFDVLPDAVTLLKGHNTLWWLDAHFPETENNRGFAGQEEFGVDETFPLRRELEIICKSRDFEHDVFIMDDLRIYEKGRFGWGNWKTRDKYEDPGNSEFVDKLLGNTHTVHRSLKEHGFILAEPKEKK